jgi:hypothetical protein
VRPRGVKRGHEWEEVVERRPESLREVTRERIIKRRPERPREYQEEIIERRPRPPLPREEEREYEQEEVIFTTGGRAYERGVIDIRRGEGDRPRDYDIGYEQEDIVIRRREGEMPGEINREFERDEIVTRRKGRDRSREAERDIERESIGQKTTEQARTRSESNRSLNKGRAQRKLDPLLSQNDDHGCRSGSHSFTDSSGPPTPEGISMFDDLVSFDQSIKNIRHAADATFWCRRLVLARTAAAMHTILLETISLAATSAVGLEAITDFSYDTFEKNAWTTKWTGAKFAQLWEQREDLELVRFKLHQSIKTVRTVTGVPYTYKLRYERPALEELEMQEREDLKEWEELESIGEYMFQIIARTTDSYLQTVQAGEAQMSNSQARRCVDSILFEDWLDQAKTDFDCSVGHLTSLATFFVPFSVVAAIL